MPAQFPTTADKRGSPRPTATTFGILVQMHEGLDPPPNIRQRRYHPNAHDNRRRRLALPCRIAGAGIGHNATK